MGEPWEGGTWGVEAEEPTPDLAETEGEAGTEGAETAEMDFVPDADEIGCP